jgi:hypothetical protein
MCRLQPNDLGKAVTGERGRGLSLHNKAYGKQLNGAENERPGSSLMGPKINARQQRHVSALGNTLGETQVRGSPRAHPGITPAHLCGTRRG